MGRCDEACNRPDAKVGASALPGLLKVTLRKAPAHKTGTLIRNPATGEMMKAAAIPMANPTPLKQLAMVGINERGWGAKL